VKLIMRTGKNNEKGRTYPVLALELLREVVDKSVVKVLTTQVGVTGGDLDLEDTRLNGQEGCIKGSSSEIEDKDVIHSPVTFLSGP
jgi:hypothetical protein